MLFSPAAELDGGGYVECICQKAHGVVRAAIISTGEGTARSYIPEPYRPSQSIMHSKAEVGTDGTVTVKGKGRAVLAWYV